MAKKPLRGIAQKIDKKFDMGNNDATKDLKGVNKSKVEPTDFEDLVMSPEGNKATVDFGKKYMKVQKHDDRVGNTDVPYVAKNKVSPYPGADQKMYEAADCTCDDDKDACSVHGKKGKKLLLGGKKNSMAEDVEFSTLDTTPGLVPAGMQAVAKNLWGGAENHLTGPTVATGQGRPFIAKLGDEIRQIQKEAVEIMHGQLDEKNWIKGAIKHPGALHRELGVPEGEKIPASKLNAAAKKPGKEGMRARLAKTLKKMHEEEEIEEARIAGSASRRTPEDAPSTTESSGIRGHAVDVLRKFPKASPEVHHQLLQKKLTATRNGVAMPDNRVKGALAWANKHRAHYGIEEETELDEVRMAVKPSDHLSGARKPRPDIPTGVRGHAYDIVKKFHAAPREKQYEMLRKKADALGTKHSDNKIKREIDFFHKNKEHYGIGEETVAEEAPPSKSSEEWIKKNKARFKKEYGAEKGEHILYGKAWNDYKEKH